MEDNTQNSALQDLLRKILPDWVVNGLTNPEIHKSVAEEHEHFISPSREDGLISGER